MTYAIGIDLGGTKVNLGLVDSAGKVLEQKRIDTRVAKGPQAIVKDIISVITQFSKGFSAVGIGMAGQIEKESGLVKFAPNLAWKDFDLPGILAKELKSNVPVKVTNDVRAAAWAEWLYGAGAGCSDLLCIFVGTGIGGGIVSGGKMLSGITNTAGEIGHMTIDLHGPSCSCGNYGCFEALASGWAIARRAKEEIACDPANAAPLLALVDGNSSTITARHVGEAYIQGSILAKKIVMEVSEALTAGVASLINAFNPEKVILGGGVFQGFPHLIAEIREGLSKRALKAALGNLHIMEASLGADAGLIGAAAYAMQFNGD